MIKSSILRYQIAFLTSALLLAGSGKATSNEAQITVFGETVGLTEMQHAERNLADAATKIDAYLTEHAALGPAKTDDERRVRSEAQLMLESGLDFETPGPFFAMVARQVCAGKHAELRAWRGQWTARLMNWVMADSLLDDDAESGRFTFLSAERGTILDVMDSVFDGWIIKIGTSSGCLDQTKLYAAESMSAGHTDLGRAVLALSVAGLDLAAAAGRHEQIASVLSDRRSAFSSYVVQLQRFSQRARAQLSADDDWAAVLSYMLDLAREYDAEFERVTDSTFSPVWRVDAKASAKMKQQARCGNGEVATAMITSFMSPNWPSATDVLLARGDQHIAASYALATLFDAPQALRQINQASPQFGLLDASARVVWQAYGKQETQTELARAAGSIFLSGPKNHRASVTIFGHEFLLTSGQQSRGAADIDWYDLDAVQRHFRASEAFELLCAE